MSTSRMGLPVRIAFMMPKFRPDVICCETSDISMAPGRLGALSSLKHEGF